MTPTANEACLSRIAQALNAANVRWALGASMMLHYLALVDAPSDIDLLVEPTHAGAADAALCALGTRQPTLPNALYGTRYFYEYEIDGVGVDLMADMAIHHDSGTYVYRLPEGELPVWRLLGEAVPLCPPEDWLLLYALLRREKKVALLAAYFDKHPPDTARVRKLLEDALPTDAADVLRRWA